MHGGGTTMIALRRANERGHASHGWLDSHHTFSFADYYDPAHMGFRALRVINEDRVEPGKGFGTHPHKDMEIVTYVLEGAIQHKDSMGNGTVIRPGEVQRMTAGTGVTHSEFNPSSTERLHFLQIWIIPEKRGLPPGYEQTAFPEASRRGKLCLVASPDGSDGSVTVHQDVRLFATLLGDGERVEHSIGRGRHAWVHVARGSVDLGDRTLHAGDGAAISEEQSVSLTGRSQGEVLLFDLA
jgi:quercetin 2,3-dioxygenase